MTGMALPWLGFAFGFITARSLGRSMEDTIAIAIETGVQNTGVSIVILWNTLKHPVGDLAGQLSERHRQKFFIALFNILKSKPDFITFLDGLNCGKSYPIILCTSKM